jgi:hypothetical protein
MFMHRPTEMKARGNPGFRFQPSYHDRIGRDVSGKPVCAGRRFLG